MNQIYTVHKTFLDGALKGMTITEQTSVRFEAGKTYGGGWTGSRYKVTAIEIIEPMLDRKSCECTALGNHTAI